MRPRALHVAQLNQPLRIADAQFLQQVSPFELKLSTRNGGTAKRAGASDLFRRKAVIATRCFVMNGAQVLSDRTDGRSLCAKPKKLRVMPVALRLAAEHGLREKRFAPQGHQSSSVEVLRMQAPETHPC